MLATTEGPAVAGHLAAHRHRRGQGGRAGEEGEVRAKGPQVTLGYLDPALDADAFDDEGWFRTGDLGTLDAEGNLTITGRLKDVIIRKGENISAKEVEDLLFTHPKVADVAVIGLPDAESGERACAVVVPAPEAEPITFDGDDRHLLDAGLITRKLPEQLEVVDALPRNPSGKIVKFELQERFQAQPGDGRRAVQAGERPLDPGDAGQRTGTVAVDQLPLARPVAAQARAQPSGSTLASARMAPLAPMAPACSTSAALPV